MYKVVDFDGRQAGMYKSKEEAEKTAAELRKKVKVYLC